MYNPESSPSSHLGFTPDIFPISPTPSSPRVLVIGAGIIGMSIAWTLLDSGYNVTILAERKVNRDGHSERLTSQIAGALWEYPPAVCGHYDNGTVERSKRWAMVSYHVFNAIAQNKYLGEKFGVQMRRTVFFFDKPLDKDQSKKMRDIESSGVMGFEHDRAIINNYRLTDRDRWCDAYRLLSPMIDTDQALAYITDLVEKKGAVFDIGKKLNNDLLSQESELLLNHDARAIVNASGLGSYYLANDKSVYPLHGAIMRVHNDGKTFPQIKEALVVSAPPTSSDETSQFVFIVPRNDHILYVGGFSEPVKPIPQDSPANWFDPKAWRIQGSDKRLQGIKDTASKFLHEEALSFNKLDAAYPFAQGLRPARRSGDVRLEREGNSRIVHCYGHAGSGWSLSFGCALEVKTLLRGILEEGSFGVLSSPENEMTNDV